MNARPLLIQELFVEVQNDPGPSGDEQKTNFSWRTWNLKIQTLSWMTSKEKLTHRKYLIGEIKGTFKEIVILIKLCIFLKYMSEISDLVPLLLTLMSVSVTLAGRKEQGTRVRPSSEEWGNETENLQCSGLFYSVYRARNVFIFYKSTWNDD